MSLVAIKNRVIIEQDEVMRQTESGILLSESAREKPSRGTILSVGIDVDEVKVGEKVYYKSYGPTEVKIEGKEYLIVDVEDIICRVEGE